MNKKTQIIFLVISFVFVISLIGGTYYIWTSETKDMESQEQLGQQMADAYLLSLTEKHFDTEAEEETNDYDLEIDDLEYQDNQLFGSHTEAEAVGTLDCVLEIPAIELRQSVFTGTPAQIQRNLSRWMSVTCRSDYVLGSTQYCIYMHNPTNKSIRISYAQETLVPGDYITLTQNNTVYFYEMTRMFPEWREVCTSSFADNMALDSSLLYIFTCARREWQGRNLVIEGKLYNTYDLSDWQENSDKYIAEYKGQYSSNETLTQESLNLDITNEEDMLKISVTRPDGCQALHCSVGIFDDDGYLIGDAYPYDGLPISLNLPLGEYIIGIYKNETEYNSPSPYQVNLQKKETVKIQTLDEEEMSIEREENMMKYIALTVTVLFVLMYLLVLIRFVKNLK